MENIEAREASLAMANEVRCARAALKRELRSGARTPQEVLSGDFPSWLDKMTVGDVIKAPKGMRREWVEQQLEVARLGWSRPMKFITIRQRNLLVQILNEREARLRAKVIA